MKGLGDAHKTKRDTCLACHYSVDRASQVDGSNKPSPGDFTICIKCGHVMVFADDMSLRDPNAAEKEEISRNKTILRAIAVIRQVRGITTN